MTGQTADASRLVAAARDLKRVPADVASFDAGAEEAARFLDIPPSVLADLADAGLPHRSQPARGPQFDYTDLTNVALRSGLGTTVPELARRFLLRFILDDAASWFGARTWAVTVSPPKAADSWALPGNWRLRPIDQTAPGVTVHRVTPSAGQGLATVVTIAGSHDRVRDPVSLRCYQEVLEALAGGQVTYQTVPEVLRQDHRRAWREGVADCVVVSRFLAGQLASHGHAARARRGYLLGLLGSDHSWVEVMEEGRWKCLDAVFELLAMDIPDETSQFQQACRGSRFNRLLPCTTDTASPLLEIDGMPAPAWALAGVSVRPYRGENG